MRYHHQKATVIHMMGEKGKHEGKITSEINQQKTGKKMWMMINKLKGVE